MIRVGTWFLCERQKPNAIMIAGDTDLGVYYNKAKVLLQNSRRATRGESCSDIVSLSATWLSLYKYISIPACSIKSDSQKDVFESNLSLNFILEISIYPPSNGNFHPLQLLRSLRLTTFRGLNDNPRRKLLYTFHEAQQLHRYTI